MRKTWRAGLAALTAAAAIVVGQALRPLPSPALTVHAEVRVPGSSVLPWPPAGESAVTISGLGTVRWSGRQRPVPIASLAKIMTAYIVLRDHPLAAGNPGPQIVITSVQAASYRADLAASQSVVKVRAGERLTERQALEALLLPSADNIARILAQWDAGTSTAFVARMNAEARALAMRHTHYAGPSGLAAATVSTARDQLVVARAAMAVPAFAAIVAMPSARLPAAGTVVNFDYALGHAGITGIKTGSDSAAGGCWAFADIRPVAGAERTIYGVVLGVPATRQGLVEPALAAGTALAIALAQSVRLMTILPAGAAAGELTMPWRYAPVRLVTARAMRGLVSTGTHIVFHSQVHPPRGSSLRAGEQVGTLTARSLTGTTSTPIVAAAGAPAPSLAWRLTRT